VLGSVGDCRRHPRHGAGHQCCPQEAIE
jgi:hypothetical protein